VEPANPGLWWGWGRGGYRRDGPHLLHTPGGRLPLTTPDSSQPLDREEGGEGAPCGTGSIGLQSRFISVRLRLQLVENFGSGFCSDHLYLAGARPKTSAPASAKCCRSTGSGSAITAKTNTSIFKPEINFQYFLY
jgi:hypothetical protein